MSRYALTAETIFDGNDLRQGTAVVIENGLIVEVVDVDKVANGVPMRELGAGMLVPGFVDVQVNGGGGVLLNATPTLDGVRQIAAAHRGHGTTGLLPTVMTDATEVMEAAAKAVSEAIEQGVPGILGIHFEGPFIDPVRKGAHDARFIRKPTDKDIDWLCQLECGRVLVTLAPNRVTPEHIARLVRADVIVSLGHAEATAEEALAAVAAGASCFTHLFNAMSPLTGRAPGMVGAALACADAYCGVIADGQHVHATALCAALQAKPRSKLIFVSDAMPSAADGPATFQLQGRTVHVVNGRLQLADGTLAGANITMAGAVDHGRRVMGLKIEDSLNMASLFPAAFLCFEDQLGRIVPGYRANLALFSGANANIPLRTLATWIDGIMLES